MRANMGIYSKSGIAGLFPKAADYAVSISRAPALIREMRGNRGASTFSERHLQCIWYDDALRPSKLKDIYGEDIMVHYPGRWNLEGGPDFINAVLEVRSTQRRICGDVEIHIDPDDWNRHGHGKDLNYSGVCAHVCYLDKSLPVSELPANTLQINLKRPLQANPFFAFEDIDLSAYPYNIKRTAPCTKIFSSWSREMKQALLEAAGQERLLRKSERMHALIEEFGLEQAVYMEVMRALGFKHNKPQFTRLAEIVPLKLLRDECDGNPDSAYATLIGVAGLIPNRISQRWDGSTVKYLRSLWREWIRQQNRWESVIMSRKSWNTGRIRPQNRIERRLAAAAAIFSQHGDLASKWLKSAAKDSEGCIREVVDELQGTSFPYWDNRLAWSGKLTEKNISLIGVSRANAIAANVLVPLIAASGGCGGFDDNILGNLKPEPVNSVMRLAAHILFGADHPPSLYSTSLRRQGLMQIFYDFCLEDKTACRECRFPAILNENHTVWSS